MVKLGGNKEAARNALQAEEIGGHAVARGNQQLLEQQNLANQQILQGAASAQQEIGDRRREETQKQQFGAKLAEDTAERQGREAIARRGQDIEMADRGLEEKPKADGSQPPMVGPPTERQAELAKQMQRGNEVASLTDIGVNKGNGNGNMEIVKGAARVAADKEKLDIAGTNAAAAAVNAQKGLMNARASGDKEEIKKAREETFRSVRATTRTLGILNKSTSSATEKIQIAQSLQSELKNVPDPALQTELADAVSTGEIGPRIKGVLKERRAKDILTIAQRTGEMPDDDDYDENDPRMRKFVAAKQAANDVIYSYGSALPQWLDFQSVGEKNRYLNKLCAQGALEGWDQLIVNLSPAYQRQQQGAQPNAQSGSQPAPAPGGAAPAAARRNEQPVQGLAAPGAGPGPVTRLGSEPRNPRIRP